MNRLFAVALAACAATGLAHAETRNVSGFTEVVAQDRIRVEVTQGDAYSVEVTGADAGRIRTEVDDGALEIRDMRRPMFGRSPRLDAFVRVTAPRIEGVAASRGAELTATITGACDEFSAAAAMGGETTVRGLACNTVDAAAAMGGTLELAGTCGALDASAAMGGDIQAGSLRCRTVDGSAAMGGSMHVFASERYDGSAAMGGGINVEGGGQRGDISASMGGSVGRR